MKEEKGPEFYREIGHKGGQKGGEAVKEKYGSEFYREIGHKGGEKLRDERGSEFYKEIGHKGGEKVRDERGSEFYKEIGKKGGEKVRDEKGREFHSEIGREGGATGRSDNRDKPPVSHKRPHEESGGLKGGAAESAGVKLPSYRIVEGIRIEKDVDFYKAVGYKEPAFPESTIRIVPDKKNGDVWK